ncbi:hypothetical protein CBR_g70692 [Chara braunii]|uniref:formate C-acetyltransferase n=1 Tax=Chara braunii TaxID=69332 RepID=A0A388K9Q7_CHABU|nr:hypothetical protein CBR_g70692 [Chara braunii]|eukprot:GBG66814.1 hypothetical protein CBR_g70692 [Chara braunii]
MSQSLYRALRRPPSLSTMGARRLAMVLNSPAGATAEGFSGVVARIAPMCAAATSLFTVSRQSALGPVPPLPLSVVRTSSVAGVRQYSSIGTANPVRARVAVEAPPAQDVAEDHELASSADVANFIQQNFKAYEGDGSFLAPATSRTRQVWEKCLELLKEEHKKGVLDCDPSTPGSILSHGPGYIDKELDLIVGFQTDAPLKRMIKPKGGWRMVESALASYGFPIDERVKEIFTKYVKTHNAGVFDAYSSEMKIARHEGILTGLPDAYGRGRIIGDYRRVALYGVDALIKGKQMDKAALGHPMTEDVIRLREEVSEQIKALKELKEMAKQYGYDIGKPAQNAREAIQWLYFGYLGAIKEQDGAAMSLGRVDAFLDTFIERDIANGTLTEEKAQELIDDFVIKLRLVRHLRTPEYNSLFAGDPTWVTAVIAGMAADGVEVGGKPMHMVTKTSYRLLHTLRNLGPAPEPNLTVLWSPHLPQPFKDYCSKISLDLSSIQYMNDDLMRERFGADNAIACCVSAMTTGKMMQFFGARCNLPKLLLYALNGGKDEVSGKQVGPKFAPLSDGPLVFDEVMKRYDEAMEWLAGVYVNTMNCIHYMHDKYNYERLQMALHDTDVHRTLAFGVAGLSVAADSLSAIKHAKVTPIRDENGMAVDFKIEGDFPKYGNDIEEVDQFASDLVSSFIKKLQKHPSYRGAEHTLSVLTITSNVVYGKHTGSTPDGRRKGEPFAPGANPLHGRDESGALSSLNSVAKVRVLGGDVQFVHVSLCVCRAHHLNVNALNREMLLDAMEHPEKYPQLTIRVSGYAVHFTRLTREQQMDVISRTFHETM